MIGDEGVAVIALRRAVVLLHADAVRGNHRHGIRHGMALHRALPARMRVERKIVGLGADGRGVEQNLGALQHHGARGLRVPLIPADADADRAGFGLPRLEAGVAGAEVIFLLIARTVGDMALAVDAEDLAVSIGNRHAVVVARAVLLEEGDGNDELQFLGELLERTHGRMLARRLGHLEPFRVLPRREVDALEQLRRQHDLGAALGSLADEAFDLGDVGRHVRTERRLDGGDGDRAARHHAGSCCVMQWNEPPPASPAPSNPRDGTPTTLRSGNTACSASSAAAPVGVP